MSHALSLLYPCDWCPGRAVTREHGLDLCSSCYRKRAGWAA